MDELKYIVNILGGKTADFTYFVDKYKNMAVSIAFQITQNHADAEEIAQDAFVKAYKSLASFNHKAKFSSWFYRIVYNTAISETRKKKHEYSLPEENMTGLTDHKTVIDSLEQEDQKQMINTAMKSLNENERSVLTFFYLEEMNIDEIADVTQLSKANIKVLLFRGRNKLKEELSSQFTNSLS